MAVKKFNIRWLKTVKPAPGKRLEFLDTLAPGLALRVTESGAKSWRVLYRHRGRLRRVTLGSADDIGLADARTRAREIRVRASKGHDPAAEKQSGRKAATVADLITDYIERHAKKKKRSWKHDQWMLNAKVLPKWKHRAIADITRRDVRLLVEGLAESAPILANRLTAVLSRMFRFALDDDLISASPAFRIPRPAPEQSRDRVLSEPEIVKLWDAFDGMSAEMGAFYKLRLVTAARGGEVSAMRWSDVDLDGGWWTIPASGSKNKLPHRVALSPMALALLRPLREAAPEDADYVLAGARGKRQQSEAAATLKVKDFRGHDLRRTASTFMTRGGIPRATVGRLLNHVEKGITSVYDRNSYDAEKSAALTWWSARLGAILAGDKAATVLPFARG